MMNSWMVGLVMLAWGRSGGGMELHLLKSHTCPHVLQHPAHTLNSMGDISYVP